MPTKSNQPGNSENENSRFAHNLSAQEAEKNLKPAQKEGAANQADANGNTDELSAAESNPTQVGAKEDTSSQEQAPWNTRVGSKTNQKSKSKGKTSKRKKRILIAVFMLIATSVFGVAAFFIFLPFKIVSLVENLKEGASHLAERPVEARMSFLVTRYLAGKIVAGDNANEFDRYVCPKGGIICSVFKTWRINNFEEKLGLTIESNRIGNGKATSWKITTPEGTIIEGEGGDIDAVVGQLDEAIDGSRLMRQYLKDEVNNKTKRWQVMKRHAMRKMLMRKYGVTGWRGPEKVENKFESYREFKRNIRIGLKKMFSLHTVGRVLKKSAAFIACLISSGSNVCKSLQTGESSPPESPEEGNDEGSDSDKKGEQAAEEGRTSIESESADLDVNDVIDEATSGGGSDSEALGKEMRSIITRRILAAGVAGIGIIDLLASVVEKIDQGDVNAVAENKNEIAYIGWATDMMTFVDKWKAGDLDPETAQVMGEIFANYEGSPLAQHEMGLAKDLGTPGHEVERDCDEDGKVEKLQPGEYVCENKKITFDYTAFLTSWPAWDNVIVPIANAWNHSVGAVFDFFNNVIGGILDAIGFNKLMDWVVEVTGLKDLAKEVMENIISTFFGSPLTGAEENEEAYDATSIGVKAAFNGMQKNGVDEDGNGMGAGGKALSDAEIADINNAAARDAEEDFKSKSLMARLFDPYLTGSAANTAITRTPSSLASLLSAPVASLSSLASPSAGAYPFTKENLVGLVTYGYAEGSPLFNAPPEAYTEETCKQYAAARDASWDRRGDEISPRYHTEDPCALERIVRISATAAYTDENDAEFKLYKNQPTAQETGSFTGQPGQTITKGKGWSLQNNTDYSGTPCAAGSTETQIYTHPINGYKIRLCKITGTGIVVASIISAAVAKLMNDSKAAGIDLAGNGITGAFRSYEAQIAARQRNGCPADPKAPSSSCRVPTAPPGQSEHERGLAIDFSTGTASIGAGSPQFNWLQANAAKYGFYNLPTEAWHWSTSGS